MEKTTAPREVKGPEIDAYNGVRILDGFPFKIYEQKPEIFTETEQRIRDNISGYLSQKLSLATVRQKLGIKKAEEFLNELNMEFVQEMQAEQILQIMPKPEKLQELTQSLEKILKKYCEGTHLQTVATEILDESIGFGALSRILRDEQLEEVMINAAGKPIFVFHKLHGMCKTNIVLKSEPELQALVGKIARQIGKEFDEAHPLLDARLPDGSRVNATLNTVTPQGISMTVRKFTKIPLSVIDLIEKRTLSIELAGFLWIMVEGLRIEPMNVLITGGAGSGKTTLLNTMATFINYADRILSIEDTLEIDLGERENWIQMEAKPGIHGSPAVTMDDLLKNSLRMRPDRIIVGEVRGEEAQTLFTAMDTGHKGILGTLHSNSAREMTLRLKSKPMNVPQSMLPLLDLAVVSVKMYDKELGIIRRVKEVAEISRMEEKVLLSNVYEWDKKDDTILRTDTPSHLLDYLAGKTHMSKNEIKGEQLIRQQILKWMLDNNIRNAEKVDDVIQQYYLNPENILEKVSENL